MSVNQVAILIPTCKNAKLWNDKRSDAAACNAIFNATERLGKATWRR